MEEGRANTKNFIRNNINSSATRNQLNWLPPSARLFAFPPQPLSPLTECSPTTSPPSGHKLKPPPKAMLPAEELSFVGYHTLCVIFIQ